MNKDEKENELSPDEVEELRKSLYNVEIDEQLVAHLADLFAVPASDEVNEFETGLENFEDQFLDYNDLYTPLHARAFPPPEFRPESCRSPNAPSISSLPIYHQIDQEIGEFRTEIGNIIDEMEMMAQEASERETMRDDIRLLPVEELAILSRRSVDEVQRCIDLFNDSGLAHQPMVWAMANFLESIEILYTMPILKDNPLDSFVAGEVKAIERPTRCQKCNKKCGLTAGITCRCEGFFCRAHGYFNEHDCSFDYKKHERAKIARDNPKVVKEKIKRI